MIDERDSATGGSGEIRRDGGQVRRAIATLPGLAVVAILALARADAAPAGGVAVRPWTDPRDPGDWSVRRPAAAASDTAEPGADARPLGGAGLSARRVAGLVDEVGTFLELPELLPLAMDVVRAAAGDRHPMLGYLHVRQARELWRRMPDRLAPGPFALRRRWGQRGGVAEAGGDAMLARVLAEAIAGEDILRDAVRLDFRRLSGRDVRRLALHRESALDLILTIAAAGATPEQLAAAWDACLRSRAVVLDELASRQAVVATSGDTSLARIAAALDEARSRLSALSFAPLRDDSRPVEALALARAEVDGLERALALRCEPARRHLARRAVGLAEIRRRLAEDEAIVAFAYHRLLPGGEGTRRPADRRTAPVASPEDSAPLHLLAFVLGGPREPVRVAPLGEAGPIDALAERWRRLASVDLGRDTAAAARAREAGDALRRRVWDPVRPWLRGARRVHVVLDGALQRVNLAALPEDPDGRSFVVEGEPALAHLGVERDLLGTGKVRGEGLLVVGDAEFGGASEPAAGRRAAAGSPCGDHPMPRFGRLAASRSEAMAIAERWRGGPDSGAVRVMLGPAARERAFRDAAPGRRALHVATHGFLREDSCPDASQPPRVDGRARGFAPPLAAEDDPLLAAGLVFAGANDAVPSSAATDDGILTAAEIASLDLRSAGWVVLSACGTALGPAVVGEGVFGLRMAFTAAGAGTVISSLWPVDDQLTLEYMRALYDARFPGGRDAPEAMRDAARAILRRFRAAGLTAGTGLWGAFLAVGPPDAGPAPRASR